VIFLSFDGVILNNLKYELETTILGAKIEKIYQPEKDEMDILLRGNNQNLKLLLSANAKYPRIHLTTLNKVNPENAPAFCMTLRKHLSGGRIIKFNQPHFERILEIYIEVMNDFRDLVTKKIIIEVMGKHSNIIIADGNNDIIDSIKHISKNVSSVRTVLPHVTYVYPPNQGKVNPILTTEESFFSIFRNINQKETLEKLLCNSFTGISPLLAKEISLESTLPQDANVTTLSSGDIGNLYTTFHKIMTQVISKRFSGYIYYDTQNKPIDFYSLPLSSIAQNKKVYYSTLSSTLDAYYSEKDKSDRLKQKYGDIKKIIENHFERAKKKKILLLKSLEDTKNADDYKLKGDLVLSYIYMIEKGVKEIEVLNFFSEQKENVKIALNTELSPSENAQKFFARYNKMKRTQIATMGQLDETNTEITYLESLLTSLDSVDTENDIIEIKEELYNEGYLKRPKAKNKKQNIKSTPLHYVSTDGFDIYVGKNNLQNDYLTMKLAKPNDIWLHTKDIPGSHVIIRSDNQTIPDTTIYEAALLSSYYSKAKQGSNVPVDYTEKRNVKKPKPGFVIYLSNKTKYVTPSYEEVYKITKKSL